MEPIALSLLVALAIVALVRRPGVFSPALVAEGAPREAAAPGDDEEEQPETDRAPRSWLPWGVAALALVRIALLVTLRA